MTTIKLEKFRFINISTNRSHHIEYMTTEEANARNELNNVRLGPNLKYVLETEYLKLINPDFKEDLFTSG